MHCRHDSAQPYLRRPIWLAVSGCLLAVLLSCAVGLLSVQQQWVPLPAFFVRLGPVWLTSCFPRLEMTSSLGCVSNTGAIHRPSVVWLVIESPQYSNERMYRLITILPEPGS
jgi:hypothetical protein